MVDFSQIPKRRTITCIDCHREATARLLPNQDELCDECLFYREHPDLAPKYWTFRRGPNNSWRATCYWPEHEPFPLPGDIITVHRKDGSTSLQTIAEFEYHHYGTDARLMVTVSLRLAR